jgi:hypothetical protein
LKVLRAHKEDDFEKEDRAWYSESNRLYDVPAHDAASYELISE